MKSIIYNLLILISFSWWLTSCDETEEIDTTAPSIELFEPGAGEQFAAGSNLEVAATFQDNLNLATFSIDIHNNFDGHAHGRIKTDPSLLKWSFSESFEISGTSANITLSDDITIPAEVMAGPYHFIVQALDADGNATSYDDDSTIEIEIYLTNNSMPQIDALNLVDGELEVEPGVPFTIEGIIMDPTPVTSAYAGIHTIAIMLGEDHEDEHSHDHSSGRLKDEEHLFEVVYEENELAQFETDNGYQLENLMGSFTLTQAMADALESDHLVLTVQADDEQGNIAISKIPVHIHFD